jgi:hypothetical protein
MFRRTSFLILVILAVTAGNVLADGEVMFNYQGRVKVGGQAFSGTGQFKFAILNSAGNATLWTNDGTGLGGGEPVSGVSLPVSDGVFNVMVGDPATGMQSINSVLFNTRSALKLRTWFSDGVHGFEQLTPDNNLVNVTLVALSTGESDFVIYVNSATGYDGNNGLSPGRAKRTIQGAVDLLPGRVRSNVTIDIADGVYREEVKLNAINLEPGKRLTLHGDESWTTASASPPAVRVTGKDSDAGAAVRPRCVYASSCSGVRFVGMLFDYTGTLPPGLPPWITNSGVYLDGGKYEFQNCKFSNNVNCGLLCHQAQCALDGCMATNNGNHGYAFAKQSFATLNSCIANYNGYAGVSLNTLVMANFYGNCDYSYNGFYGFHIILGSQAGFAKPGHSGRITGNGSNPATIWGNACAYNLNDMNAISGNGSNAVHTDMGGCAYY